MQEQVASHGKTRQINFYNIDSKFYFVDLPGYGYSKMSKVEQEKVGKFIEQYLFTRENISLIFSYNYLPVVSITIKDTSVKYISYVYDSPNIALYTYSIIYPCIII